MSESTTGIARPKVSSPELVGDGLDSVSIMNALRGVIDPELGDNIVDLGMVKRLERGADGAVFSFSGCCRGLAARGRKTV